MKMGGQVRREQNHKKSNTPCTSPFRTCVTDSLPAGPPQGTPQPPTLALHANTMLAAPSCPGHPSLPLPPTHSLLLVSDAHAHLVLSPRLPRDESSAGMSRVEVGNPRFPFSLFRIKMRVLKLSWFLFYFFSFSSILACLLREGILKKKKKKKDRKMF